MESMWSPQGVHLESMWSLHGVHMESTGSPQGIWDSRWTPGGVHRNLWGSVTYSNTSYLVSICNSMITIGYPSTYNFCWFISSYRSAKLGSMGTFHLKACWFSAKATLTVTNVLNLDAQHLIKSWFRHPHEHKMGEAPTHFVAVHCVPDLNE